MEPPAVQPKVVTQAKPAVQPKVAVSEAMIMNQSPPPKGMMIDRSKKKSSRDAARQRRGQQNDEYGELALQLPLPAGAIEKLDRLCVMRLSNSFIKIKHILHEIASRERKFSLYDKSPVKLGERYNSFIQDALGGFVIVLAEDGQCLYVSQNVSDSLGLHQLDLTGHSIYKYVHPCDQENLARQLGGHVPLADMEIFDGLFCDDVPPHLKKPPKQAKGALDGPPNRSFFLRMKSTLTSRGKSVNINASIHRVVQCTGTMQMYRMKRGISDGSITRCFIGIGTPLLCNTTFEVPIDRKTFITKHSLDMRLIAIEEIGSSILGYQEGALIDKSWYVYCHVCDLDVLKTCHGIVLQQGQSVSGYYRVMVKQGGWIWLQTKANVVYSSSTRLPSYILCTQYAISGIELEEKTLSLDQLSRVTRVCNKKRAHKEEDDDVETRCPPSIKPKTEGSSPVYEYNYPKEKIKSDTTILTVDSEGSASKQHLLSRSPWIPYPFLDANIQPVEWKATELPTVPTSETPVVPASVDTNNKVDLSFDDLSFPDESDCHYQELDFGQNTIIEGSEDELYDCGEFAQLTNAKVPSYLLFKEHFKFREELPFKEVF